MNKFFAVTILSVLLAACSQATTPTAQAQQNASTYAASLPQSTTSLATVQAARDQAVEASFNALSVQALAPQVYLNALLVSGSGDTVRSYVKSTFTSPVTCTIDFGDGSAVVSVQSPTTSRIQTLDHTYGAFGTYTQTVTCMNGGTVVGTQSVMVSAGRRSATFDFENPVVPADSYTNVGSVHANGYSLDEQGFAPIWSAS